MSTDLVFRHLTVLPVVKGGASSHRAPGHHLLRDATMTRQLAARFARIGSHPETSREIADRCTYVATRLLRCAANTVGWCCESVVCPGCSARKAIDYRTRVEKDFLAIDLPLAFVTLTTPHEDLDVGLACIKHGFGRLRRRRVWGAAFARGTAFIEIDLCPGRSLTWNVHLHAVVVARGNLPSSSTLGGEWRACLASRGATGRADCQPVTKRGVTHRRPRG